MGRMGGLLFPECKGLGVIWWVTVLLAGGTPALPGSIYKKRGGIRLFGGGLGSLGGLGGWGGYGEVGAAFGGFYEGVGFFLIGVFDG